MSPRKIPWDDAVLGAGRVWASKGVQEQLHPFPPPPFRLLGLFSQVRTKSRGEEKGENWGHWNLPGE